MNQEESDLARLSAASEYPILRIQFQAPDGQAHQATVYSTWNDPEFIRAMFEAHSKKSTAERRALAQSDRSPMQHATSLREAGYRLTGVEMIGATHISLVQEPASWAS